MARQRHGPVELEIRDAKLEDVFEDMVRVHQAYRPFAKAGRIIGVSNGDRRILAVARGSGPGKAGISMDSAMRTKLGVKKGEKIALTFDEPWFWEEYWWACFASDAMARIAARMGVLSLGLGLIGLGLGVISLILGLIALCQ